MSRFMMRPIILLMLILCSGLKVEANPLYRCLNVLDTEETLDSIMILPSEKRLDALCPSIKAFFKCMRDVAKEFGYDLKDRARLSQGSDFCKAIQLMANTMGVIEEICTEGSQLRKDFLMVSQCVQGLNYTDVVERCDNEAFSAATIYYKLMTSDYPMFVGYSETRECVITFYKVGCLGAKMYEECGERAFNTYKEVLRTTGFFKLKMCSPNIIYTLKTTILNMLEDLESRRSVYRKIFDMKKKRK